MSRTIDDCKKLVEDDPNGLGSAPGLLQQILNVDERLAKLESTVARAGNPPAAAPTPASSSASPTPQ